MIHRRRFAETLRAAREKAEVSQEELAERAGLHRTYISQLERGLKSPSLDIIVSLAKGLRLSGLVIFFLARSSGVGTLPTVALISIPPVAKGLNGFFSRRRDASDSHSGFPNLSSKSKSG
ncbi:MAG: helix-turn-helix transcriptional regulator [Verrucomicrobiota bacterium]